LFVDDLIGKTAKIGRILVGAYNQRLSKTDMVELPSGTEAIYISEQEPEITHIQKIMVREKETGRETMMTASITLHPGESRRFDIPKDFSLPIIIVDGYYEPLRP
jgi:hypothetical protein